MKKVENKLNYENGILIIQSYLNCKNLSGNYSFSEDNQIFYFENKELDFNEVVSFVVKNLQEQEKHIKGSAEYALKTRRGKRGFDEMMKNIDRLRKSLFTASYQTL